MPTTGVLFRLLLTAFLLNPALGFAQLRGAPLTDAAPIILTGTDEGTSVVRVSNGAGSEIIGGQPFGAFAGGVRVAVGDVNADGIPDLVLAMGPGGGAVRVFNGADYSPLYSFSPFGASFTGGNYVATGDLDRDGRADIIVGGGNGSGLVRIYSGADGHEIIAGPPFAPGYSGGVTVAAGDVNADGQVDLILAMAVGGLVEIIDGATYNLVVAGFPYGPLFFGGVNVAAGDVNGDGRDEVITAPRTGGSQVNVFDVRGSVLGSAAPFAGANGTSVAAGDVDGDGLADVIVGAGAGVPPQVAVFSLVGPRRLTAFLAADPGFTGGVFVAASQGLNTVRFVSAATAVFNAGTPGLFTVRTTGGSSVTLSVEGTLPAGVTFSDNGDGTGTLSGTASGPGGIFAVRFVARRGALVVGRQQFTVAVHTPVAITSTATTNWLLNQPSAFTITSSGFPIATLSSSGGWPAGVTFVDQGNGTALLSGTPTAAGTFTSTITATNSAGSTATQTFTLVVSTTGVAPTFTSGTAATFTATAPGSFVVTTSGIPVVTSISVAGALPTGVTFTNNGDGTATLAGTPALGSAGTYPLVFTAANGVGSPATQNFTLTVANAPAPAFATSSAARFHVGANGTFRVVAIAEPAVSTISLTGSLPTGVTFTDHGNGTATITGAPAAGAAGSYPLTLQASNGGAPSVQSFTLTVDPPAGAAPTITSANTVSFVAAVNGSFTVTTTGTPAPSVVLTGTLPAGVTFTPNGDGTATLGGTPAAGTAGVYSVTLAGDNGIAAATQVFTLIVSNAGATPTFRSATVTTFRVGAAGAFTVASAAVPGVNDVAFSGSLPIGLTFTDNGDGTASISGTPAANAAGAYVLTLTAANGVQTAQQTLVIDVHEAAAITSADVTSFAEFAPGSFTITTRGTPVPVLAISGALPSGVTFVDNSSGTGTLSGTPAAGTQGSYPLTITAVNGVGASATQSFTLVVTAGNSPPVITVTAGTTLTFTEGDPATVIDTGISIVDSDDTNLESATVQITANYESGVDVLGFVNQSGIAGSFNPATGTLSLTGSASLAAYVAALESVTFLNASNNPSQQPRSITWTVNDGTTSSAGMTNVVAVVAVNDAPLVSNETFELLGNTELRVDMPAGATPHTSETTIGPSSLEGVLDNESDPDGDPLAVSAIVGCGDTTAPFDCTLPGGAVVHVAANGEFSYTPAPGATSGSFTYTVTDTPLQGLPSSVNGTVTFTVLDMIWYVDGDAAPGGTGTSAQPFTDFAALTGGGDADGPGDYIFVQQSTISGGIVLEQSQHLLGEGVGLSIDRNLNGNGAPTLVVAPGTAPLVSNPGGNAVSVTTAAASEIRGLTLAGSVNAIDVTTTGAIPGGATLTISNNVIDSAGAEGIDVTLDAGTAGTLAVNILNNSWNTANAHGGPAAIDVAQIVGRVVLDISGNVNVKSSTLRAIVVTGGSVADAIIAGFANNSVHGSTAGAGLWVNTGTFDADPSTAGFQQVNAGFFHVGTSVDPVGTAGMQFSNVQGNVLFTDLDLFATTSAIIASGGGAGLAFGVTPAASGGTSTLSTSNFSAVDASNVLLDLRLSALNVVTSTSGVTLTNVAGQFGAPAGSSIVKTGGPGAAFAVDNSAPGDTPLIVSFGGTIANGAPAGQPISINNADNGSSLLFSGAVTDNFGNGISLTGNTGATITFTGGITLNGAASRFVATGGGTVTATNVNTIGATTPATGPALNVSNTTIGAAGLTFRSISASGGANGIVLDSTGATAGLNVTGTGAAGSGGEIQSSTGAGISLANTVNPQFAWLNVHNIAESGISGVGVTNFTLLNSTISDVGTAAAGQYSESNVAFNDGGLFVASALSGVVEIRNNTLMNARRHGIQIENGTGTISSLTIEDNVITSSASPAVSLGSAILVLQQGSAATSAHLTTGSIKDNTISNFPSGEGIVVAGGSGNAANAAASVLGADGTPITIAGNAIDGGASRMGSNAIRAAFNGQNGVSNFDITSNGTSGSPITNIEGQGISVLMAGTVTGTTRVLNNFIAANQTVGAGTHGLAVQVDDGPAGLGTSAADYNFLVAGNTVSGYEGNGIRAIARASLGRMDVTMQGNSVSAPTLNNFNGIRVDSGSAVGNVAVCLAIDSNTSAGSGLNAGIGLRKQGTDAAVNDFGIVGLAPSPTTAANAAARVDTDNPAGGGVDILSGDNFTSCTITP